MTRGTGRRKPAASTFQKKTAFRPGSTTRSFGKASREHLLQLLPQHAPPVAMPMMTRNSPYYRANRWDRLAGPTGIIRWRGRKRAKFPTCNSTHKVFRTPSGCHQPDERRDGSIRDGDARQSVDVRLLPVDESTLGRARPGKSQSRNIA